MQSDLGAAAFGSMLLLFIFVWLPGLILFIAVLMTTHRTGIIRREAEKQTRLLEAVNFQLAKVIAAQPGSSAESVAEASTLRAH